MLYIQPSSINLLCDVLCVRSTSNVSMLQKMFVFFYCFIMNKGTSLHLQ